MNKVIVIFTLVLCINRISAEYPSNLPQCNYGDTECIKNAINTIIPLINDGIPELNLKSINPLFIGKLRPLEGGQGPVNLAVSLKNSNLHGLSNLKVTKVLGFGKNIKSKYQIEATVPEISITGDYKMKGRLLVLPVVGDGKLNLTMTELTLNIEFDGEPKIKDGQEYLEATNVKLSYQPSRVIHNFQNLFGGDKVLGDNMNKFMDDNWKTMFDELKPILFNVFSKIVGGLLNNVFDKLPYNELFLNGKE